MIQPLQKLFFFSFQITIFLQLYIPVYFITFHLLNTLVCLWQKTALITKLYVYEQFERSSETYKESNEIWLFFITCIIYFNYSPIFCNEKQKMLNLKKSALLCLTSIKITNNVFHFHNIPKLSIVINMSTNSKYYNHIRVSLFTLCSQIWRSIVFIINVKTTGSGTISQPNIYIIQ